MSKKVTYIVYNPMTFVITNTFEYFGKEICKCLIANYGHAWINTSHPKNKERLQQINNINGTSY